VSLPQAVSEAASAWLPIVSQANTIEIVPRDQCALQKFSIIQMLELTLWV
jgi:hypothetical protein